MRANDKARRTKTPTVMGVVLAAFSVVVIPWTSAGADPDLDAALRTFGGQQQRREQPRPVPVDTRTGAPASTTADLEAAAILPKLRENGLGADAASDFARQSIRRTTEIADAALATHDRIAFNASLLASVAAVDLLLKSLPVESTLPASDQNP